MVALRTEPICTRRQVLQALWASAIAPWPLNAAGARANVPSSATGDYSLAFERAMGDLIGDLEHTERGNPQLESSVPHGHWYSHEVRRRFGSWGPRARTYPALEGVESRSLAWRRERVIATAARYIGYGYQHHHIPDWSPPFGWPWKPTCVGHNGKGFDCSNFSSFVYNQAYGIHFTSSVGRQAELHTASEGWHHNHRLRLVELPRGIERRQELLATGDLVFIRGREGGAITHVVLWVGGAGRSESGVPLVLDSHGAGVKDDRGRAIPCGVHLRPFREHSWYDRCASHALRVFHD
jgi:cell wall-associated NlpC family hydrolase